MKQIQINIPFIYTIGEPAPYSGNIINTAEEAEEEVRLEFFENDIDPGFEVDEFPGVTKAELLKACEISLKAFRMLYNAIELGVDSNDIYNYKKYFPLKILRETIEKANELDGSQSV